MLVYKYNYGDYTYPSLSITINKYNDDIYEIIFEQSKIVDNAEFINIKHNKKYCELINEKSTEYFDEMHLNSKNIILKIKAKLNPMPENLFILELKCNEIRF